MDEDTGAGKGWGPQKAMRKRLRHESGSAPAPPDAERIMADEVTEDDEDDDGGAGVLARVGSPKPVRTGYDAKPLHEADSEEQGASR